MDESFDLASPQVVRHILRGHEPAVEWFLMLVGVAHLWDDLIDGDREVTAEIVNKCMWNALVELPRNGFWREHAESLTPVLVNAIANWHAATRMERDEREPGRHKRLEVAFVVRSDYANLLLHAAYLVGGRDWLLHVAPMVRERWTDEDLSQYLAALDGEARVREDTRG